MKSREHKNSYYLREHGRRENLSFLLQKRSFLPMLQKTSFLFFLLRKAFFAFLERQSSFAFWKSKLSLVFCESFHPLFKREACSFSSTINFHVFSHKRSFHCFSKDKLSLPSKRQAFIFLFSKNCIFALKAGQNLQPQTLQGKLQDKAKQRTNLSLLLARSTDAGKMHGCSPLHH